MKQQKKEERAQQRRDLRKTAKSLAEAIKKTKKTTKPTNSSSKSPAKAGTKVPKAFTNNLKNNKKDSNNNSSHGDYSKKRKVSHTTGSADEHQNPTKKRVQVKTMRQAQKPNAALVGEMKNFWNLAREKNVTQSERDTLISSIVAKMKGNTLQVTLRHDASRAVQCILQFGTIPQRWQILNEMSDRLYEIAKTPYGHFVVLKAITYCTEPAERTLISNSFRGHFVSLGTNVIGARTVETLLQLWPKNLTRSLKAEFYGHKFLVTLSESPNNLHSLIEIIPTKKDSLLDHMRDLCQRFVDKSLLEFSYVHQLLWEYISECITLTPNTSTPNTPTPASTNTKSRITDMINLLSDSTLKLITTKPGARVMCIIINNSTAKDRKKIMKSLKGHVLETLLHDSGHLPLIRLIDVTDDTVNIQKMLFEELISLTPILKYSPTGDQINDPFPPLIKIAKSPYGRKVLLRLLSPNKRHLEPDEEIFFTNESIAYGTSKKQPNIRRQEHVIYLKTPLLAVVLKYLHYLITCPMGSGVLLEIISTFFPSNILEQIIEMFCGRYQINEGNQMSLNQNQSTGEEEGEGEGEDEDEEEEEGEEENDDEEHDEGEEHEEDEEGEEDEGDEYGHEDLQQALKEDDETYGADPVAPSSSSSQTKSLQTFPLPDLSTLEENQVAQLLLKRILDLEATIESHSKENENESDVGIDQSLWEKRQVNDQDEDETEETEGYFHFAHELSNSLFPDENVERLPQWIQKNRTCFILSDLLKVPSARLTLLKKLKPLKKQIKSNSKTLAGGKCLLSQME